MSPTCSLHGWIDEPNSLFGIAQLEAVWQNLAPPKPSSCGGRSGVSMVPIQASSNRFAATKPPAPWFTARYAQLPRGSFSAARIKPG